MEQVEQMDVDEAPALEQTTDKTDTKSDAKSETKAEKRDELICEDHANESLLEDQHEGTVVCSKCGFVVVEQTISGVSEWRDFADDSQADIWGRSRVGGPSNRFLSSGANLATTIRPADNRSRLENAFNSSILRSIKRKSVDNGIYHGLRRLDEMADRIHLTQSVLEYAHYLYYKMYKKGQFKGIALAADAKVSACLYIACYHAQCPRTVNEIRSITENDHDSIRSAIKRCTKLLKLPVGPIACKDVMPRYCAWLSLPHQIEREASHIATSLSELDEQRVYDVEVLSATAIYVATQKPPAQAKYKRTQKDIANSLGITRAALSECYRSLASELK